MTTADKGITSRFTSTLVGAVRRTIQNVLDDAINVKHFGAKLTGTDDDSIAWGKAITACSSDNLATSRTIEFYGKSLITAPITISKNFCQISGEGPFSSQILNPGVAGGGIKLAGQSLFRGIFRDFGLVGNSASGIGLDLSGVTSQVYNSEFSNLYIESGGTAFYAPGSASLSEFFNNQVQTVICLSYNGHGFHTANGPGTTYQNCYVYEVPAGKAGYRMAGLVTLLNCNGLNEGDVWAAFGSNPAGTDGFQNDFGYVDYPIVNMIGCNIERFGSLTTNGIGVRCCNLYRVFNEVGCTWQRADADIPQGVGSYKAILSFFGGCVTSGGSVQLNSSAVYLRDVINGTGTNTPSLAHLYFESGGHIEDRSLAFANVNITTYTVAADALAYPVQVETLVNDVFGGFAKAFTAISPRRTSLQMLRYATGAALTPVGVDQNLVVTGKTKVLVTPGAAASVLTATFDTTPGAGTDRERNGDLIIEATNANLTIKHSAAGANVFVNKSGGNYTLAAGEIRRYLRSETNGNWREV